jgi:hypothetical protein
MPQTKFCPTCVTQKSVNDFGKDKARADGLQSQCRACKSVVQKRWYQANKARHVANVARCRRKAEAKIIGLIVAYLREHPCVDCGETNPVVLEFDHVKGQKQNSVCNLIRRGCGWEAIAAEIQKCEVRCCKCHCIKTAKQFGYRKLLLSSTS